MGIKQIHKINKGGIVIKTFGEESAMKLKKLIETKLNEKYIITLAKMKNGLNKKHTDEQLLDELRNQNYGIYKEDELKITFCR